MGTKASEVIAQNEILQLPAGVTADSCPQLNDFLTTKRYCG